jgi:hypothetical protein
MPRLRVMMILSTLLWTLLATGCATSRVTVREISSDRMVRSVQAGVPFVSPVDGKFVPTSRFIELLDAYVRLSDQK